MMINGSWQNSLSDAPLKRDRKLNLTIAYSVGIGEILAFHSAVFEKVDVEKISLNVADYRIAEDVRYYRQLAGLN